MRTRVRGEWGVKEFEEKRKGGELIEIGMQDGAKYQLLHDAMNVELRGTQSRVRL